MMKKNNKWIKGNVEMSVHEKEEEQMATLRQEVIHNPIRIVSSSWISEVLGFSRNWGLV